MVRVHGVGVVAADQHALRQRAPQLLGRESQGRVHTLKGIAQKRRHGALLGVRAHLLVVEAAEHRDGVFIFRGQKRGKRYIGAPQVIQTRRAHELVAPAPHGRLLAVHQEQVTRQHLLGRNTRLLGDQPVEEPGPEHPCRHDGAHVNGTVRDETRVRLAIKVDGNARYEQQVLIGRDQTAFHAIAQAHQHAAGNGQGFVEPGVVHHAAVRLHVQPHIARRTGKLRSGFDLIGR